MYMHTYIYIYINKFSHGVNVFSNISNLAYATYLQSNAVNFDLNEIILISTDVSIPSIFWHDLHTYEPM